MKILGMGVPEMLIILLVVLLLFGPKNLPKLGEALGKTVSGIRKGMEDDDEPKRSHAKAATTQARDDAADSDADVPAVEAPAGGADAVSAAAATATAAHAEAAEAAR